ncbi:hypothetical protein [Agarivorans sp.]|uniref:hypothetical protein n=1 Tax=Agarivorans sp. TaxID=1872412 RepID=UPI003D079FD8
MKKTALPVLLSTALLSACGGSDSNHGPTAPRYSWQIIQLHTLKESDVKKGCVIYATAENDPSRVITASVANSGYNILFHHGDGSIIEELTIPAIDVPNNGIVTINSALVPDEGYVSLEEIDSGLSGNPDVYMFSMAKSLLSDQLLNVRSAQTNSDCYKGKDYRKQTDIEDNTAVSVLQESGVEYYQSSYGLDRVAGRDISAHIPVLAPLPAQRDTLITAYYSKQDQQLSDLAYYGFVEPSYLYNSQQAPEITAATLSNQGLIPMYWQAAANLSLDQGSAIVAMHDQQSYLWQPLYQHIDQFTIAPEYAEVSHWSALFAGESNDSHWRFQTAMSIDTEDSQLVLALPELSSMEYSDILQDCPLVQGQAKHCIDNDASFEATDFALQRTQVRLINSSNRAFYQSIYAEPKAQQPLLQSSAIELSIREVERLEIALIDAELNATQQQYFMAKYMNSRSIAETGQVQAFSDANGVIIDPEQQQTLYLDMLKHSASIVQQAK